MRRAGLATLLIDLLTEGEEMDRRNVFDIPLLAKRLARAAEWARSRPDLRDLPIGYFGASTGGGAALLAASDPGSDIAAVVSRGGRPDLAGGQALRRVRAPTLLIVGGADTAVIELNREAMRQMACECAITLVPGATHLFEEAGALDEVVRQAVGWFVRHMGGAAHEQGS
jgi:putative phosphoribosyl transferase